MRKIQFSKYERFSLMVFCLFISVLSFWPLISHELIHENEFERNMQIRNDSLVANQEVEGETQNSKKSKEQDKRKMRETSIKRFPFDPNQINRDSLRLLGLSSRITKNWIKYLEQGGYFSKIEDVKKVYGMDQKTYDQLKDWMKIEKKDKTRNKQSINEQNGKNFNLKNGNEKHEKNFSIAINQTSKEALIQLPGIGEILSERIIKYRDALGGFTHIGQLKEVYGLPQETIEVIKQSITIDTLQINKLSINNIEFKELLKHPYCDYELTKILMNFRQQHGPYQSENDFNEILMLDKSRLERLVPYLDFSTEFITSSDSLEVKSEKDAED